jgi:O-antigen/teichoic acid export membrane protein
MRYAKPLRLLSVLGERLDFNVRAMLWNAGSLIGTTAVTSLLGLGYWMVAAKYFSPAAVGLAAALLTSMTFLSIAGVLGLGTVLIREFPGQPGNEGPLMITAVMTAVCSSSILAVSFILIAPHVSTALMPIASGYLVIFVFGIGVALTAVGLVFDSAVIGLLRGGLQLMRNSSFAVSKFLALIVAVYLPCNYGWAGILGASVFGSAASLASVVAVARVTGSFRVLHRPRWTILRRLRTAALSHHSVNLSLQAPGLTLPIIATITLSPSKTASFYLAFQVAGFSYVTPVALSLALYAVASSTPSKLPGSLRFTIALALTIAAFTTVFLFLLADRMLGVFGPAYTTEGPLILRILSLAVFPLIIKDFYIALSRLSGQLANAGWLLGIGAGVELMVAIAGGRLAGLQGFTTGALLVECVVAAVAAWPVLAALRRKDVPGDSRTGGALPRLS